jgi:hypothetical protein
MSPSKCKLQQARDRECRLPSRLNAHSRQREHQSQALSSIKGCSKATISNLSEVAQNSGNYAYE